MPSRLGTGLDQPWRCPPTSPALRRRVLSIALMSSWQYLQLLPRRPVCPLLFRVDQLRRRCRPTWSAWVREGPCGFFDCVLQGCQNHSMQASNETTASKCHRHVKIVLKSAAFGSLRTRQRANSYTSTAY